MRDFSLKIAADGQGGFCFKCLLLHLLILSAVFHVFLKIKTSNKQYMPKNELIYPFSNFPSNPYIFMKLG